MLSLSLSLIYLRFIVYSSVHMYSFSFTCIYLFIYIYFSIYFIHCIFDCTLLYCARTCIQYHFHLLLYSLADMLEENPSLASEGEIKNAPSPFSLSASLSFLISPWIGVLSSPLLFPSPFRFLFLAQVACNRAITGRQARNSI